MTDETKKTTETTINSDGSYEKRETKEETKTVEKPQVVTKTTTVVEED